MQTQRIRKRGTDALKTEAAWHQPAKAMPKRSLKEESDGTGGGDDGKRKERRRIRTGQSGISVNMNTPRFTTQRLKALVLEAAPFMDIANIERQRRVPLRRGAMRELQIICGEWMPSQKKWLDGLKYGMCFAEDRSKRRMERLYSSAKQQCGAWCVFDVLSIKYVGWVFNGKCWASFGEESDCATKYSMLKP